MRYAFAIAVALTAFFVLSSPRAQQGMPCAETDKVMAYHAQAGQKIVSKGTLGSGATVYILADKAGVWALVLVSPDNSTACLAAMGEGWQVVEPGRGA